MESKEKTNEVDAQEKNQSSNEKESVSLVGRSTASIPNPEGKTLRPILKPGEWNTHTSDRWVV
jgi:hypothetical protein